MYLYNWSLKNTDLKIDLKTKESIYTFNYLQQVLDIWLNIFASINEKLHFWGKIKFLGSLKV